MGGRRKEQKPHNKALGTVLARLRRSRSWSQEALAFEAGITREYVSLLERGKRSPTLDTLMQLSSALALGLDELAKLLVDELSRRASHEHR